jgi:hypothetical protein
VRLYYVAGTKSIEKLNEDNMILNHLTDIWSINKSEISTTAERFFTDYKKLAKTVSEKDEQIVNLQMRYILDSANPLIVLKSDHDNPTVYFSMIPGFAAELRVNKFFIFYFCLSVSHPLI